jgi:enoyl-CoA hydratase/carnithine racemase
MRSSVAGDPLRSSTEHGVLTLTLNRPDRRNAIDAGLLSELAEDDLLAAAAARVERMLGRAPLSFAAAKRLLQAAADVDLRSGILAESLAQTALLQTEDHREGLAAAREKREPSFKGT